ncbi:MAG: LysR substrate-binding domain-containing protein [Rhodoplanes sp.]
MRYFVKVVEVGNMTRAADQLRVAQPALGLQIRQLEDDLGVALLVRHSRGVVPTEAGRLLYDRAVAILAQLAEARGEVAALGRGSRETVTLGLSPSLMLLVGSDLMVNARRVIPDVFLSLVEELSFVLVEALERGELDVALAYEVPDRPGLQRVALIEEELVLVAPPGGIMPADPISLSEALDSDLVMAGERDSIRQLMHAAADAQGIEVRVAYEARSVPAMKNLVRRGVAASIMPYGSAIEELRSGLVVTRRIDPPIRRTLYLAKPAKRAPLRNEAEVDAFLRSTAKRVLEALGPLARPL